MGQTIGFRRLPATLHSMHAPPARLRRVIFQRRSARPLFPVVPHGPVWVGQGHALPEPKGWPKEIQQSWECQAKKRLRSVKVGCVRPGEDFIDRFEGIGWLS